MFHHRSRSPLQSQLLRWIRAYTAESTPARARSGSLSSLPRPKAEFSVTPMGRFTSLIPPRRGREVIQRIGSTYGGTHKIEWIDTPRNVLIVVKKGDGRSRDVAKGVIEHITEHYPHLVIIVEPEIHDHLNTADLPVMSFDPIFESPLLSSVVDFVIAVGGDGTMLRVSSMFDDGSVPPVVGINTGTLGFMMPVRQGNLPGVLRDLLENRASILLRMRLQCHVFDERGQVVGEFDDKATDERAHIHVMNEVTLHRGASPHLIRVDTKVDGSFLTEVVADGLLVSTPTGSTAYSLSSGGPIVHPSVQSLGLTAIAPRSLSFRTVLLPSDCSVELNLSSRSRSTALLSLDGATPRTLTSDQCLSIKMSPFPVPCIHSTPLSRLAEKGQEEKDDFIEDMRKMLRFNSPFMEQGR